MREVWHMMGGSPIGFLQILLGLEAEALATQDWAEQSGELARAGLIRGTCQKISIATQMAAALAPTTGCRYKSIPRK